MHSYNVSPAGIGSPHYSAVSLDFFAKPMFSGGLADPGAALWTP
jgi:hypothetical protein